MVKPNPNTANPKHRPNPGPLTTVLGRGIVVAMKQTQINWYGIKAGSKWKRTAFGEIHPESVATIKEVVYYGTLCEEIVIYDRASPGEVEPNCGLTLRRFVERWAPL